MKKRLNKISKRYKTWNPSFKEGILFFIGLSENPYNKAINDIHLKNVNEKLFEDWFIIGNDLKNVINANKHLVTNT